MSKTIFPYTKEERNHAATMLRKYGLKADDYIEMLEQQNSVCAICENADNNKRLAVDHCHKTNKVRGLLCTRCNTAIGLFGDNLYLLKRAFKYISQFQSQDL